MSLHSLPAELVLRIHYFLDPGSHLNFSLTDKHIHNCSSDILTHHQRCSERCRECLSEEVESFLKLLSQVATDPIAAWHVRHIKATGGEHLDTSDDSPRASTDREAAYDIFIDGATTISEILRNGTGLAGVNLNQNYVQSSDNQVAHLRDLLRSYHWEVLQVLFFALCPRLRSIKFSNWPNSPLHVTMSDHNRETWNEWWRMNLFGLVIRHFYETPDSLWPCGFRSLRNIRFTGSGRLRTPLQRASSFPFEFFPT